MVDDIGFVEVDESDTKTSFAESALFLIKVGTISTVAVWIASVVAAGTIPVVRPEADTTFIQNVADKVFPIAVGFVSTLIGWFVRDQTK